MAKASRKKAAKTRSTSKRERISPRGDTRYAKRTKKGRFKEMDDSGRSLSQDRRKAAKKKTKSGFGDQGDRQRRGKKKR